MNLFSVNKMLGNVSNAGHGFCICRSRVSREMWASKSAWSIERIGAWESGFLGPELVQWLVMREVEVAQGFCWGFGRTRV